ncbi:MFS transporter [Actinomadura miaoliensis]|uniref:MFS transporter n=1 Tax=Actinomadura miaoliensis TaxID=430685 RepID=A0ABP7V1T9_9ACTN
MTVAVRRRALWAVAAGVFCIQFDSFALNLALPAIGRDLGGAEADLQWVLSAYLLATGTLMLTAGRLGDLLGRRRLLLCGLTLFTAASLGCALAPSLPLLVAARVAQGAGAAMIMPAGLALLTGLHPPGRRGRAIGWALGLGGVATAGGPLLGGLLTETFSWRAVFWLNVPLGALAARWAAGTMESRDEAAEARIDWPGLLWATAALGVLALAVDRAPAWTPPATAAAALLAAVLLTGFLRRQKRAGNPLVDLGLLRNRPYTVLTITGAVANTATVVFLFVVPLSLQHRWHLPAGGAGAAFLAPAAVMAVSGPVAGRVRPHAAPAVMCACLAASAAALAVLAAAPTPAWYLAAATVAGAVLGTANALTLTATQSVIRAERAGEASGVTKTAITLAAGLGVACAGAAMNGDTAPSATTPVLYATASVCVTAALVAAVSSRRARLKPVRRRPAPTCSAHDGASKE